MELSPMLRAVTTTLLKILRTPTVQPNSFTSGVNPLRLPTLAAVTLIFITLFGGSVLAWFKSSGLSNKTSTDNKQAQAVESNLPRVKIESELITIGPRGFQPEKITRRKGKVFLAFENRSGIQSISLRINRVDGNRLKEVTVTREQLDWIDVFDLLPGRYLITEANHPNWACSINVTSN